MSLHRTPRAHWTIAVRRRAELKTQTADQALSVVDLVDEGHHIVGYRE